MHKQHVRPHVSILAELGSDLFGFLDVFHANTITRQSLSSHASVLAGLGFDMCCFVGFSSFYLFLGTSVKSLEKHQKIDPYVSMLADLGSEVLSFSFFWKTQNFECLYDS